MRTFFAFGSWAFLCAGCTGIQIRTVRIGEPSHEYSSYCPLQLLPGSPPAGLEPAGRLSVTHPLGMPGNDPRLLAAIKPKACELGGDKVTVQPPVSDPLITRPTTIYSVWRTPLGPPAPPQKF